MWVKTLCKVFKDPVTSFITCNAATPALFADDQKPSEDDIEDDPQTNLATFVQIMLEKAPVDDNDFT